MPYIKSTFYSGLAWLLAGVLSSCSIIGKGRLHSEYGDRPGAAGFKTVVLDAGHGGRDSGARANGIYEKNVCLDLVKRMEKDLSRDFNVVLVRDDDTFVPLDDRVKKASRYGDAVLVSVHFNHGRRRLAGPETFYWRSDSYSLAKRIQKNLNDATVSKSGNRGLVRRRLRLTRNPQIPCVLLEAGYLTSAREAKAIKNEGYREKLARGIANAIRDQAAFGDQGMGTIPPPIYMPPSKASDPRGSL